MMSAAVTSSTIGGYAPSLRPSCPLAWTGPQWRGVRGGGWVIQLLVNVGDVTWSGI